jgi:hypothetical protein
LVSIFEDNDYEIDRPSGFEGKHSGVTGDLLGQPILADLPGVRIYV